MHDYQLSVSVSDQAWNATVAHADEVQSGNEFFAEQGVSSMTDDTRRRYRRVHARGRAIAVRGSDRYGVFTNDVSPIGIGFFSPIPLLPKEIITLHFEESEPKLLEIRRCMRTDEQGYSCGGNFQSGPMSPGQYRNFLAELRD